MGEETVFGRRAMRDSMLYVTLFHVVVSGSQLAYRSQAHYPLLLPVSMWLCYSAFVLSGLRMLQAEKGVKEFGIRSCVSLTQA